MIAQSCHALRLFCEEYPDINREWYEKSNNIVVLQAGSKEELAKIAYDLTNHGVKVSLFKEPDLGDELTAIAVEPAGAKYLSCLPLALKQAAQWSPVDSNHTAGGIWFTARRALPSALVELQSAHPFFGGGPSIELGQQMLHDLSDG